MEDRLNDAEMELWHLWKQAAEAIRARVADDVSAATGLSDPDFGVLTRVAELGHGLLRQNELASSMGWHRSRLSHHLTRMEQRALVTRRPTEGGVEVLITDQGRAAVAKARPLHAAAVRRHLLDQVPRESLSALRDVLARLASRSRATPFD
ncbi:MarR family winged helix-turn-helix transcriptional regulator [Streptomyces sp. NPDC096040]|uniref:MarR family winged helix-turn-helix transcriptional regulator n=1 Tax=Streptomyces sp. NPDC096040 TaxID=3155541 RepID=UPI003333794E